MSPLLFDDSKILRKNIEEDDIAFTQIHTCRGVTMYCLLVHGYVFNVITILTSIVFPLVVA